MPLLLSEQKRFAQVVDSLRELSLSLEEGGPLLPARLDPRGLVAELAQVFSEHCASADAGLSVVAAERRDLLPLVVDLRTDHAALSEALTDLRLIAEDQGRWTELPLRIAGLLKKLAAHREAESALIGESARSASVA